MRSLRLLLALAALLLVGLVPSHPSIAASGDGQNSQACPGRSETGELCCVSGYVFVDGSIVAGATVKLALPDGTKYADTTSSNAPDQPPAYGFSLSGLVSSLPLTATLDVTYGARSWHLVRQLHEGQNWINIGAAPYDFDRDGKTDISLYNPGSGHWRVRSSLNGAESVFFGEPGVLPTPADYNRDGLADMASFDQEQAHWLIGRSWQPGIDIPFGAPGDKPAPADYDGDGRADLAVYHPSTGLWSRQSLEGDTGVVYTTWGDVSDIPVPADYDGDGRADVAVYRPSTTIWYVHTLDGKNIYQQWGMVGDIPVPADYDGDRRADFAQFRPSSGYWYIHTASGAYLTLLWGLAGDIPAPDDYDGDGRADFAVFRPSTTTWYIHLSSGGPDIITQFGSATDLPLPGIAAR